MIAIVDYGVGNLFSLLSSLRALDLEAEVTGDAGRLRAADRIILPGSCCLTRALSTGSTPAWGWCPAK